MKIILPEKNTSPDVQIIGKNDIHYDSMVNDREFMDSIEQRNKEYNDRIILTKAGDNAAQNAQVLVKPNETYRDWLNNNWRPWMACVYMITCITDFIIFPMGWSMLQAMGGGAVTAPWQPITLQGAGLYHLAMGAILGIAAYGRTREKLEGKS